MKQEICMTTLSHNTNLTHPGCIKAHKHYVETYQPQHPAGELKINKLKHIWVNAFHRIKKMRPHPSQEKALNQCLREIAFCDFHRGNHHGNHPINCAQKYCQAWTKSLIAGHTSTYPQKHLKNFQKYLNTLQFLPCPRILKAGCTQIWTHKLNHKLNQVPTNEIEQLISNFSDAGELSHFLNSIATSQNLTHNESYFIREAATHIQNMNTHLENLLDTYAA